MIFGREFEEGTQINDVDTLTGNVDSDSAEGVEAIADEVENNMQATALESMTYFDGGEEAQKDLIESSDVLVEAQRVSRRTFVRLGKNDDLTRRAHLASLVIARNAKDPLFNKLAKNRVMERKLRNAIFKKYQSKAIRVAKVSQKKHIKTAKNLPPIRFN